MNYQITYLLLQFLNVLRWLLFARAIMSWFVRDAANPIYQVLVRVTEPIVAPFRNLLANFWKGMMIDISLLLALLFISLMERILIWSI